MAAGEPDRSSAIAGTSNATALLSAHSCVAPVPRLPLALRYSRDDGSGFGAGPPVGPGGRTAGSGFGEPPVPPLGRGGGSPFTTPYVYVALPASVAPLTFTVTTTLPAACAGAT